MTLADAGGVSSRPRGRLVPFVATVLVVALCITAGNWQRRRMHEKERLAAALAAAARMPAVALPAAVDDWTAWRYRKVAVLGHYDAATQFLLDNRVREGVVGFDVVTPLGLANGSWVLVDRGFVAMGRDRRTLPDLPPPAGDVRVEGAVELPPAAPPFVHAEPAGMLWPRLDPALYAARTARSVLPVYVAAERGDVGQGLVRDWPAPDLGTERHLSYMVQWYLFAAMAAGLWLFFTARHWLRGRA